MEYPLLLGLIGVLVILALYAFVNQAKRRAGH
jgi:Flp pilus assembly pilin Flp